MCRGLFSLGNAAAKGAGQINIWSLSAHPGTDFTRYENEEDQFLQEMESIQQQCAVNTDTSDEHEDATPVLGTLCNLVGEISQLRKENRKLRRRLSSPVVCGVSRHVSSSSTSRSVIERVNAFLDRNSRRNSHNTLLPRLITTAVSGSTARARNCLMSSGSSSGIFNNQRMLESCNGARERLSSPPKDALTSTLTVSSYSADLSSDTFSSCNRPRKLKPPPPILPEAGSGSDMVDSEMENIFHEVSLPSHENNTEIIDDSKRQEITSRSRRSMTRRSQFSSISEHTSSSSASACSSVEPQDHMTSSRSSFLELIGLRKKRDKLPPDPDQSFGRAGALCKKRKRKISGCDATCNPHGCGDMSKRYSGVYSRESKPHSHDSVQKLQEHDSWSNLESNTPEPIGTSFGSIDTEPARNAKGNEFAEQKLRPKSMVYLDPPKLTPKSSLRGKTKSCKSINADRRSNYENLNEKSNNLDVANDQFRHFREERESMKNEVIMLKTRNNRLIDQLREKSMQISFLDTQKSKFCVEKSVIMNYWMEFAWKNV
ncbi:hypothetical protein Ddc_01796 [Ditylenchus destructor]|nr:hypothetical protein Ddc_01796 [Ditylenchus destructor]